MFLRCYVISAFVFKTQKRHFDAVIFFKHRIRIKVHGDHNFPISIKIDSVPLRAVPIIDISLLRDTNRFKLKESGTLHCCSFLQASNIYCGSFEQCRYLRKFLRYGALWGIRLKLNYLNSIPSCHNTL